MASTADTTTNTVTEWKEELEDLIMPDLDVENVKKELGSGSYGEACVIQVNGVSFTLKKIHISIFCKDEFRKDFVHNCLSMSKLRHPNVVQFLGLQIHDSFSPPSLITELFSLNLTTCIQRYPEIPLYSKYSILRETTSGVEYLHQQLTTVHGHLCPNNILLTEGLHVKISDSIRFGVAILSPPNSPYSPPENGQTQPGDVFSLGDIILLVILQKEVSPLEYKHHRNPENENEPVILTEVKRRERFLKEVEETHQLKSLVLRCLEEEPEKRPSIQEISKELDKVVQEQKPEYHNILEMFVALGQLSLMKDSVSCLKETVGAKEDEIEAVKGQLEPLKLEITSKEEVLAAQKNEIEGYKQALQSKEGRIKAHETGIRAKEALVKAKDREITAKKQVISSKEALLRSTNKRIEVLEQHVKSSRRKINITPLPTTTNQNGESNDHHSKPFSPESGTNPSVDGGLRPTKPYRGGSSPNGNDRFKMQRSSSLSSGTQNQTDPRLATILARQQQRINDDKDAIHEASSQETESHPPVVFRKRSNTIDGGKATDPQLKKILQKRKSFIEDDA